MEYFLVCVQMELTLSGLFFFNHSPDFTERFSNTYAVLVVQLISEQDVSSIRQFKAEKKTARGPMELQMD